MERRRPRLDPVLAEQVNGRLAFVLADRAPRRAQSAPGEDAATAELPLGGATASDPAPEPSDPPPEFPDLGALDPLPPVRRFTRRHVGVVVALAVLALLGAGWALLRAQPVAVAGPGELVVTPPSAAVSASPSTSTPAPPVPPIVVHVLGAVRKPGVVTLPDRSRVQDAIKAAGGLLRSADPGELNLAQLLSDGQQVVIGSDRDPAGEVRDGGGAGTTAGGPAAGAMLDLNRATAAQLEELPGVGPVTAGRVVAWRSEHQRFSRVEELQEVDGIGPKTYAQIAPHVRV